MQLKYWMFVAPLGGLLPAADVSPELVPVEPLDLGRPGELVVKILAYTQQDKGGIEEVDEDASVFETVIFAKQQMTDTGTLQARLLGDVVSAASIERAHNASWQALQGGASGNYRVGFGLGWAEQGEQIDWHFGLDFAKEYAYLSTGGNVGLTWNMPGRNTSLSANLQVYLDTVTLLRFDGQDQGQDDRDTYTIDLSWQQIWSPIDITVLTLTQSQQSGFLATSYNSVFPPSGEASEELPDSRSRTALTLRWRHSLSADSALEMGGRYYRDDWDIDSATLDLRYSHYLFQRRMLLEPSYRFTKQNGSSYYSESFTDPLPQYRTSDPDLGDFNAHMLGLTMGFLGREWLGHRADWDVSLYASDRDNGLTAFWLILGYRQEF